MYISISHSVAAVGIYLHRLAEVGMPLDDVPKPPPAKQYCDSYYKTSQNM